MAFLLSAPLDQFMLNARQSIRLVVSLTPACQGSTPQEFSKVDVDRRHIPVRASHSSLHFL